MKGALEVLQTLSRCYVEAGKRGEGPVNGHSGMVKNRRSMKIKELSLARLDRN